MTVHICATKPQTNDTDGVDAPIYGLMSAYAPPEIGGLTGDWDVFSVTNVYFSSFCKTGDVARAEITIGEHGVAYYETIRIYAADNLEHPSWTNVYEHDYQNESSLTVQFDMSQFPTSFLHRAFFGLDYPQDSDGDGISDGDERYRYHSNPAKYDTDDDGLGDGDELRIGSSLISADTDSDGLTDAEELGGSSVMSASQMLWLDTSSCDELSLGRGGSYKNWNVSIPGGVGIASSEYTSCNISLYGRLSFGDSDVFIDACGMWMYAYSSWSSKVLCGSVITNGVEYFVVEYRNISTDSIGTVKLTCQIIVPKTIRNVIYVSYQRVDDVIEDWVIPLGVTCSDKPSPFDPQSEYSILPPVGYRVPVANTTIKYIIGLGSDPTVYNRYEEPVLPSTSNSNAYYTVDIVADDHAHIVFTGDGLSDLPDPDFWALPGETNRVKLLMGKSYVANANVDISCIGASDSEAVVSNVSERAISVVRPVRVTAMEGNGLGFLMRVNPSNLNGAFSWTNSCCSITGNGSEFWYVHTGVCTCGGCYAVGVYRYEGYSMSCFGGYCDCPHYRDEWPHNQEDDEPYAEGISISFSAPAVIYEDAYENNPTSTVPRRSTQSTLSCVVHGGESGGTARFNIVNASKIDSVEGYLPDSVFIPPMQKLEFDVCYEGNEPSVSADDVVVTGTFTPRNGGTTLTDSDTLTSIRLSMTAVYEAPENPCTNRHVYGVGEKVRFDVVPKLSDLTLLTVIHDVRSVYHYESFEGASSVNGSEARCYICPIAADFDPQIKVQYNGVEYMPLIEFVEPQMVVTTGASWGYNADATLFTPNTRCWPDGEVGEACLVTTNYIGPMHVSFQGIAVSELPCSVEDVVTGCFTNGHNKTHTRDAGAGKAYYVGEHNFWFVDAAVSKRPEYNWAPDSTLSWNIPIGWHRKAEDALDRYDVYGPDYEYQGESDTRPLIVGGVIDRYKQVRHIDGNGLFRTDKYGHWTSRSRHCVVTLDGRILQEEHQ